MIQFFHVRIYGKIETYTIFKCVLSRFCLFFLKKDQYQQLLPEKTISEIDVPKYDFLAINAIGLPNRNPNLDLDEFPELLKTVVINLNPSIQIFGVKCFYAHMQSGFLVFKWRKKQFDKMVFCIQISSYNDQYPNDHY